MLNKTWPAALLAALPLISAAQTTVQDCQEAMRRGDFTAAARHGREAGGYDGLMCAGRAQLALSDYASAASTFAALETSAREPFQQAVVAIFRARCARGLGRVEEALAHYERSLTLARSLQYKQAVMTALNESGQLLQAGGDVQGALARFREAYDHAANDNERAECHHLIAFAHSALGNHDKAIEHQLKSVVLQERSGEFDHYLAARLALAEISMRAQDFTRAQREIDQSLLAARENANSYWETKILLQSARLERLRGNGDRWRLLIEQARSIAEKSGTPQLLDEVGMAEMARE